jgi:hypothetical protein
VTHFAGGNGSVRGRVDRETPRTAVELTCASCGRPAKDLERHEEEWRDAGHRPLVTREVDPFVEKGTRSMHWRPRR